MKTAATIIAAGVGTVALACGVGAGLAYADPPSPTPTPTVLASPTPTPKPSKAPKPDQRKAGKLSPRGLAARALHGEMTMAGERHRVIVFQRGGVEKVSNTSVTVRSSDGYTASYAVNADTRIRKNKDLATIADVAAGDQILVVATKDGSTVKALRIRVVAR